MAITTFKCLSLRGDKVSEGIELSSGFVPFSPRWGMNRGDEKRLATTPENTGTLHLANIKMAGDIPVLFAALGAPDRELVLIQEYSTGVGAKRWPGFKVEIGEEASLLSSAQTYGGSGGERHSLVSTPLGWAENIAAQFLNIRDQPNQVISYSDSGSNEMISSFAAAFKSKI